MRLTSLTGRKVQILRTHTTLHIPGYGQFDQAVDTTGVKYAGKVEITVKHGSVLLEVNDKGQQHELIVPFGNIISLLLIPDEANNQA